MSKYLYIVVDLEDDSKHLSYHKSQKSACYEVARLSSIPYTMTNSNTIESYGGWLSDQGHYFVLEKDLLDNQYPYESKMQ